ncbi:unnamed protein product [Lymnaea stagnalis]|uniref:Uncharacterized protein n=1 Tax=Lymnaea stagnalis TaxID=6523 RepID=A0AAV2IDG2_LYMST
MTSQKRYRHHQQDSNNGSSRFRDLPPRFKRQKSSSSPPPKPLASSNEENNYSENTSRILVQDMSPMTPPGATATSDGLKVLPGLERTNLGLSKLSPVTLPNDSMWTMLPRKEQQPVLSPVDNMHFNNFSSSRQSPPAHIPLGTHFGYSPPMSPWSNTNTAGYPGQTAGIFVQSPWSQSSFDPYSNQRLRSPPSFSLNNENHAPNINMMPQHSPVAPWTKSSFSPQPVASATSQAQRLLSSSSPPILKENTQPIESPKPDIDYSDPDIRTIEMLRELERVADEKDNDDFGVDRKSLVSHHLRMLMCAVDRYTEGVEVELTRREEVTQKTESPVHTPRQNSPAPSMTLWTQDPMLKGKDSPKKTEILNWNQNKNASLLWQEQERKAASTNQQGAKSPAKICNPPALTPPLQAKSVWDEEVRPVQPGTPAWDLWSSPSFDFCGVLGNQGSCDSSDMPFFDFFGNCNRGDLLGAEEMKERKPLYKR